MSVGKRQPGGRTGLLVRADASESIGDGHVMRTIALAQAWRRHTGEDALFLAAEAPPKIVDRIRSSGCNFQTLDGERGSRADLDAVIETTRRRRPRAVVLDGYCFQGPYQAKVRCEAAVVLVIDDGTDERRFEADLLLNPNAYATDALYRGRHHGRALLGLEYSLIRDEFHEARSKQGRPNRGPPRVLVTLGGSSSAALEARIVRALSRARGGTPLTTTLISGQPEGSEVATLCHDLGFEHLAFAANVAQLMTRSDLLVSGAGSTLWESLFLGLPAICIVLAQNQENIARTLSERGLVRSLGWGRAVHEDLLTEQVGTALSDSRWRSDVARRGPQLVDGKGAYRVVDAILGCPTDRNAP